MLDVSIVIVSYNTKDLIVNCVDSIIRDASKLSREIIIIDNASTDTSIEALKQYRSQHDDVKIRIFRNKENLGFAKANNQGIRAAKGKHILLLNSDTLVTQGAIDKMVAFAESSYEIGVVGARLLNEGGSVQPSCYNDATIIDAISQYWFGKGNYFDKFAPSSDKPTPVNTVVGAAFLITQTSLKHVGSIDERYFMYYEDRDYCRRVWQAGLKVYYLPEAQIYHVHGASGKNIASEDDQWKRLVPSSIVYNGPFKHYALLFIMKVGQKLSFTKHVTKTG